MAKVFYATRSVTGGRIGEDGSIRRISRNPFASGPDVAVCSRFAFRGGLSIGNVRGLHSGDVVKIYPDGKILRLWDVDSLHNCIFVTSACNFKCLMCPQPPCADNPHQHEENLRLLNLLRGQKIEMIGITGGEPTMFPSRLIEYFKLINSYFPSARVEVLTNGSPLSKFTIAKQIALKAPLNTCYCISIHGDTPGLAESIMGCSGGWDKALMGLVNLAKLQQQIEIRLVLTKKNVAYMRSIVEFFYRNFPFVSHVALMGQEIVGEAENNYEQIWVEPRDYQDALQTSLDYLAAMDVNVSVYNVPLCLLSEKYHKFAARSISDWKQEYREICGRCSKREGCCGFFTTSKGHVPKGIEPFA